MGGTGRWMRDLFSKIVLSLDTWHQYEVTLSLGKDKGAVDEAKQATRQGTPNGFMTVLINYVRWY